MSKGPWKKSDADRRNRFLGVRLTDQERERLEQAARARGMSASDVAREGLAALLGPDMTPAPMAQ